MTGRSRIVQCSSRDEFAFLSRQWPLLLPQLSLSSTLYIGDCNEAATHRGGVATITLPSLTPERHPVSNLSRTAASEVSHFETGRVCESNPTSNSLLVCEHRIGSRRRGGDDLTCIFNLVLAVPRLRGTTTHEHFHGVLKVYLGCARFPCQRIIHHWLFY